MTKPSEPEVRSPAKPGRWTRLGRGLLGNRPPADLRARLEQDERVVAWGLAADETPVAATTRALLFTLDGEHHRLGWHEIHKAGWDAGSLTITPAALVADAEDHQIVADGEPRVLRLAEPRNLPPEIRTRVTRSVAYTAHHDLPSGGGARVVARRISGANGVSWAIRYDPGTDSDDAADRTTLSALLAEARQTLA